MAVHGRVRQTATLQRFGVVRIELERLSGTFDRVVKTAQVRQRNRPAMISRRMIGSQRDQPVELRQCVGGAIQGQQGATVIVERGVMFGIDRDRALVANQGVVMLAEFRQDLAFVGEQVGIARAYFQRAIKEIEGIGRVFLERFDGAQKMQRDDVSPVVLDHDRAHPVCLSKFTGLKRHDRLSEELGGVDAANAFAGLFLHCQMSVRGYFSHIVCGQSN